MEKCVNCGKKKRNKNFVLCFDCYSKGNRAVWSNNKNNFVITQPKQSKRNITNEQRHLDDI